MRPSLLVTVASFITLSLAPVFRSEAQVVFASNKTYAAANVGRSSAPDAKAASSSEKIILMGKITNPAGVLPGAVVILKASRQMAVTNADGEFQFEVPANSGALQAVVTYAGYADEPMTLNAAASQSTVSLTNASDCGGAPPATQKLPQNCPQASEARPEEGAQGLGQAAFAASAPA